MQDEMPNRPTNRRAPVFNGRGIVAELADWWSGKSLFVTVSMITERMRPNLRRK